MYKVFILVEQIYEPKRIIRLKYVFFNVRKIRGNEINVFGIVCIMLLSVYCLRITSKAADFMNELYF